MKSTRIAIIFDDCVRPDTTGFYCRRALASLVDIVHVRPDQLNQVNVRDFDLFIKIDDGLRYQLPSTMHPCVWWAIDTHLDLDWYRQEASRFDLIFTAQRDGALELAKLTGRAVHWLPLGCDPAFHRRHDLPKKWDVSFVGNLFPGPRADLVQVLQEQFQDVYVGRQFFDDMARIYSESCVVFNRSIRNDVNMRVFEAVATGSLLLTNELTDNGLTELFEYGKHLEVYQCAEELLDKVSFYLAQEHARERIARLGRLHAFERHTYRCRMQRLLETASHELSLPCLTQAARSPKPTLRPSSPAVETTSIIVLTYNQIEYTRQCLDSIRANTSESFELIVVDNGSTDGTVEYLEDCPDVVLVCNRENRGFPTAANQGARLARGRWVLLLNNDTIVPPGWLGRLIKPLMEDESIGLVGPSSNAVSGPQQIDVDYESIAQMDEFASRLAVGNAGIIEDSERLVGFCMLIRRAVMDRIGLLDEQFGIGCFEDDDYTLRARLAGFRTVIVRNAFVHHFGSQTFRASGIDLNEVLNTNQQRFISKWSSPATENKVPDSAVLDQRPALAESRIRLLLLAHVDFLNGRLDRSQYLRYLALSKQDGVVLFGPGIAGYRKEMSVEEAVDAVCGGKRPDWILHGLDPHASGIPLVGGLRECGIPTAYEFGDSWTMREEQSRFINEQGFRIAFILATRDIPFYRVACPNTEFHFLPNAVDTSIFSDYGEDKQYDVLLYGGITPDVYPLSARIFAALDGQDKMRVHRIVHPDYCPRGGWSNDSVIAGEKLSRAIGRAWISISTQSVYEVLLMKHLEIAASGTAVAGDMSKDGHSFFGRDFIDLSACRSDVDIISRLSAVLDDKDQLMAMAYRCRQRAVEELSTDQYAIRLLQVLAEFSSAATNNDVSRGLRANSRSVPKAVRSRISLCMIVRNNEETLDAALESIKPWVDEMVVVDTGSTDRTPDIAKSHNARVFYFPWPDSFAIARNESIRHATGDWIFWMDSDDTISAENGRKLRELVARPVPDELFGYIMQVHCPNESDDSDQDMTVVDHIKLFRNRPDLRFQGRIHEQIMPAIRRADGEVEWTDISVVHSGSDNSEEGRRRKQERDLRLLQMEANDCPNQSFVLFNIGMTYADMGDHQRAATTLEQSVAVAEPTESHLRKAYALLAGCLSSLGHFQQADEVCRAGRALFPADVELLFREGLVAHQLGQLERAVKSYMQALRAEGERYFASVDRGLNGYKTRHNLAIVLEELGRLREAEEQWRLVVSEVPSYRPGWRGLAGNLIQQKKYDMVERVIAQMSHHPRLAIDICLIRADLEEAVGDPSKAVGELEAGLAVHGPDKALLERTCKLLFELGSPEHAESRLKELLTLDQTNPSVWHNLGSIYLRLKRYELAADAFRTATRLRPDSAVSYLYMGFALEELKDHGGARTAWRRASEIAPDDPAALEARVRLRRFDTPARK